MKKILVIGSMNSGSKNDPQIIVNGLEGDDVSASLVYWEDIVVSVRAGEVEVMGGGKVLSEQGYDLVIAVGWYKSGKNSLIKDLAYAVALYFDRHQIVFWNREMIEQRSVSKLSCMVQLAIAGVPVPDTIFNFNNSVLATHDLPFVAKAAAASRGRSNYLVRSEEERLAIDATSARYLVQEFLPNDHDLRVICMGGVPQLILKRSRQSDASTHINNISTGAEGVWLQREEVDTAILTISEKICKILGRELAGIDFIPDASSPFGYSCLEVNAIPQLTSGHDVEIKMAALKKAVSEL